MPLSAPPHQLPLLKQHHRAPGLSTGELPSTTFPSGISSARRLWDVRRATPISQPGPMPRAPQPHGLPLPFLNPTNGPHAHALASVSLKVLAVVWSLYLLQHLFVALRQGHRRRYPSDAWSVHPTAVVCAVEGDSGASEGPADHRRPWTAVPVLCLSDTTPKPCSRLRRMRPDADAEVVPSKRPRKASADACTADPEPPVPPPQPLPSAGSEREATGPAKQRRGRPAATGGRPARAEAQAVAGAPKGPRKRRRRRVAASADGWGEAADGEGEAADGEGDAAAAVAPATAPCPGPGASDSDAAPGDTPGDPGTLVCLRLCFDGGSRGNPGPGGAGAVLYDVCDQPEVVWRGSQFLGDDVTNNQAEYQGLLLGLQAVVQHFTDPGVPVRLEVRGDSKLVIEQVQGNWKVRNVALQKLHRRVGQVLRVLREAGADVQLRSVPRADNSEADRLVNLSIDAEEDGQWRQGGVGVGALEDE